MVALPAKADDKEYRLVRIDGVWWSRYFNWVTNPTTIDICHKLHLPTKLDMAYLQNYVFPRVDS